MLVRAVRKNSHILSVGGEKCRNVCFLMCHLPVNINLDAGLIDRIHVSILMPPFRDFIKRLLARPRIETGKQSKSGLAVLS